MANDLYEYRVERRVDNGNDLDNALNEAADKGYRLSQCIFTGYAATDNGNVAQYTLIFERVKEKQKARTA